MMANLYAAQSLAEALAAGQEAKPQQAGSVFVDQLATALAFPANDQSMLDDAGDEDLDLPMLVQGTRSVPVIAEPPVSRRREGKAALIGFGLGLATLVPIGIVMSSRLNDQTALNLETVRAEIGAVSAVQGFLPVTVVTDEIGIRTTRRTTQSEAGITLSPVSPAMAAVAPAVDSAPSASEPAPPDHLKDARQLIAKGDIETARQLLTPKAVEDNPAYLLALAETFDPNMLAAWGVRGATADVLRARALYQSALLRGEMKARQRLEALE